MKKSYMKGLAIHRGPALCAIGSNAGGKVSLVLGRCKLSIELRNHHFRVPALSIYGFGDALQCVKSECCNGPAESKALCEHRSFMRENRESPDGARRCAGRLGKTCGRNPNVYAAGKSDVGNSTVDPVEQCPPVGSGDGVGKDR